MSTPSKIDIRIVPAGCYYHMVDRLNNLKRLRHEDEAKLSDLLKTRDNITNLAEAKIRLGRLYDNVLSNFQDNTPEIIKLALDALDIEAYASVERAEEIKGVIPLELPTTAQTSA